jgi:hypothetical protein
MDKQCSNYRNSTYHSCQHRRRLRIYEISLSVGAAYAQGVPAGFQEPHYGAQAFSDHPNQAQTQFLLGQMYRYNSESNHQVAAAATSGKGGNPT